jgi:Glycosyl transferase family 8
MRLKSCSVFEFTKMIEPESGRHESPVLAVTLGIGEKYELLARLSAESCEKYTGLKTRILGVREMARHRVKKPHHLKFRLFQEFPTAETIFYFDADTIFLKGFDTGRFRKSRELVCVRDVWDRNWIREDAERVGIAPKEYFNSGLFIVNRTHHKKLLEIAEGLLGRIQSQFNDQTVLNAARAQLGIPTHFLGKQFNYLAFENCPDPKGVTIGHLSGMGRRPAESIKRYHQFWSRKEGEDTYAIARAVEELAGGLFEYHRVGYDWRQMRFEVDGSIGNGKGGSEQRWAVSEHDNEVVLWIIGRDHPTCALTRTDASEVWQGRWLRNEQMPILLSPIPADTHNAVGTTPSCAMSDLIDKHPDSTRSPAILTDGAPTRDVAG